MASGVSVEVQLEIGDASEIRCDDLAFDFLRAVVLANGGLEWADLGFVDGSGTEEVVYFVVKAGEDAERLLLAGLGVRGL